MAGHHPNRQIQTRRDEGMKRAVQGIIKEEEKEEVHNTCEREDRGKPWLEKLKQSIDLVDVNTYYNT